MKFDLSIDLAIGHSAKTKIWKNTKVLWSELVQRLSEERKTTETFKEYIAANKEDQLAIKDVGGYVGGYLRAGRRKPENVIHRQLLTLDIDFAHADFWDDFTLLFENAAVLHSSHKHHPDSPRYRLLLPLSREVSPDEYIAISRQIAGSLNIDLFDGTTFEPNRLMFWPSNPKDVEYYFRFQDGPAVDPDAVLATYSDWTDSSLWPTSHAQTDKVKTAAGKQEDPQNKKGIVGSFCRTYTISEAIAKFLSEEYAPAGENRYTYVKGTTAAGLMVYDDKFAFSHHGTDPASGKLSNAFDLVRIHKFGHEDNDSGESGGKLPSFKKMEEYARADKEVKKIIAGENLQDSRYDFAGGIDEADLGHEADVVEWMQDLEVTGQGKYLSSATNINTIFANDIRLKGHFRHNKFDSRGYVFGNLPWRKVARPEPLKGVDLSGVRNYIESIYGITGPSKISDVLTLEQERNSYHPITDYLRGLTWDGTPRVDTLLIDYFGAEDNQYTREAIRKMLVGAIARVINPGVKFELVLTLVGEQGCGKSTFIQLLGKEWYSDTFSTLQGNRAFEQLQGAWMIEIAELAGLKKAEVETIKHFISKQVDLYRKAYGEVVENFVRQCVFFGTTNNKMFLRDPSGNRRFLPVDVRTEFKTKDVFTDLTASETDQIWAEAMIMFRKGETLFLSPEASRLALIEQSRHSEIDDRKGIIENYLNRLLPEDWEAMDMYDRRNFLDDPLSVPGTISREFVCVAEVWCECLGKPKEDMDRYKTRDINDILRGLDGWEQSSSTRNFKHYGKQKYYARSLF